MIQRIVLIKLTDEHASNSDREAVVKHTEAVLTPLPGVLGLAVGTPADDKSGASWDVGITLLFDDIESVETYKEHPEHRRYVDEFLAPQMAVIKAWNFALS